MLGVSGYFKYELPYLSYLVGGDPLLVHGQCAPWAFP